MYFVTIINPKSGQADITLKTKSAMSARSLAKIGKENKVGIKVVRQTEPVDVVFKV